MIRSNPQHFFGLSVLVLVLSFGDLALFMDAAEAASSTSQYGKPSIHPAIKAIRGKEYKTAISKLLRLNENDPTDPDVLSLLGFSNRKLGNYAQALSYYKQALAFSPRHRGANEYLGELYLEINQLAKAEQQLAVLDDACPWSCKEYRLLDKAIEKYRAAHASQ